MWALLASKHTLRIEFTLCRQRPATASCIACTQCTRAGQHTYTHFAAKLLSPLGSCCVGTAAAASTSMPDTAQPVTRTGATSLLCTYIVAAAHTTSITARASCALAKWQCGAAYQLQLCCSAGMRTTPAAAERLMCMQAGLPQLSSTYTATLLAVLQTKAQSRMTHTTPSNSLQGTRSLSQQLCPVLSPHLTPRHITSAHTLEPHNI